MSERLSAEDEKRFPHSDACNTETWEEAKSCSCHVAELEKLRAELAEKHELHTHQAGTFLFYGSVKHCGLCKESAAEVLQLAELAVYKREVEMNDAVCRGHIAELEAAQAEVLKLQQKYTQTQIASDTNLVEYQKQKAEVLELRKAVQSRHDYGPASPGEQEAAWTQYCKRTGWNPLEHPAAKNAYVEGFCDGDSFSEGDESRAVLRAEVRRLREALGKAQNRCDTALTLNRDPVFSQMVSEAVAIISEALQPKEPK